MATGTTPTTFGAALRALRERRGLTQAALANAAALTPNTVARLERGEQVPRWDAVQRLADALGVTTERLRG